jgi:1,4-dihydroxy-2-naphthoate octaprenyltransferase
MKIAFAFIIGCAAGFWAGQAWDLWNTLWSLGHM